MRTEPICPAGFPPDASSPLGRLPRPLGRAVTASADQSRGDFLHAVRMLEADSASHGWRTQPPKRELHDVWTTFVGCPRQTWEQTFQDPDDDVCLKQRSARRPVRVWRYHCSDGVVHCVIHVLDRPEGQWILVLRVCCF